jgi:uncharacterized protein involved in tolerance to divalent cations
MTNPATPITSGPQWVELILGCTSWQEAQHVADNLLRKQLVTSVEFMESATRRLHQHIDTQREVQLIMASLETDFSAIEAEIRRLLARETFALQTVPLTLVGPSTPIT